MRFVINIQLDNYLPFSIQNIFSENTKEFRVTIFSYIHYFTFSEMVDGEEQKWTSTVIPSVFTGDQRHQRASSSDAACFLSSLSLNRRQAWFVENDPNTISCVSKNVKSRTHMFSFSDFVCSIKE